MPDGLEVFERRAVAQLGRLVGFDGAVWGRGSPLRDGPGVQIDTATVIDRDVRLLDDDAATGSVDPVARRFFEQPSSIQSIVVGDFYRGPGRSRIGDCLAAHDIAHVLLAGGREVYSWLTAYRRDADAPFAPADAARYAALLPHWVQAREICAELERARELATEPECTTAPASARAASAARRCSRSARARCSSSSRVATPMSKPRR